MFKMVLNSETGGTTSGKDVIATGPPRARCTKATTTQTWPARVYEPLRKNTK